MNFLNYKDKIAITHKDENYTYKQLHVKKEEIKNTLLNDVQKGEIVAILGDYDFDTIGLFFALYENKNIIVPISSKVKQEQYERIKEAFCDQVCQIKNGEIIITKKQSQDKHEMIKSLQDNQNSGLILFSSGSTGKPKAMIHNLDNLVNSFANKKEKNLKLLIFLMFDHIGGINTLLNIFAMGSTMIIPQNRTPEHICSLIEKHHIRVLPSSPTFLNLILISEAYKKYDLSTLRMITYGTETMPDELLKRLKKIFSRVKFLQTFGTSETGIANTSSLNSNSTYMKIDDKNLQYKIVDGELYLKSKTQILGYLNASMENFTDDGWFKTGDLVEVGGEHIKIIGRNKEVINVGGEKVLPNEVESVILELDEIRDVMIYPMQSPITGQMVVCDVVTNLDKKEAKKTIRSYCKTRLDKYKIPTKVNVVESLHVGQRFKKKRL